MDLVGGLGDLAREADPIGAGQRLGRANPRNLSLQPHPERRYGPDRLGHGDAVRTLRVEPGLPERGEETIAGVAVAAEAHLADQRHSLLGRVRSFDIDVVLDDAPASRLVSGQPDRAQARDAAGAGDANRVAEPARTLSWGATAPRR